MVRQACILALSASILQPALCGYFWQRSEYNEAKSVARSDVEASDLLFSEERRDNWSNDDDLNTDDSDFNQDDLNIHINIWTWSQGTSTTTITSTSTSTSTTPAAPLEAVITGDPAGDAVQLGSPDDTFPDSSVPDTVPGSDPGQENPYDDPHSHDIHHLINVWTWSQGGAPSSTSSAQDADFSQYNGQSFNPGEGVGGNGGDGGDGGLGNGGGGGDGDGGNGRGSNEASTTFGFLDLPGGGASSTAGPADAQPHHAAPSTAAPTNAGPTGNPADLAPTTAALSLASPSNIIGEPVNTHAGGLSSAGAQGANSQSASGTENPHQNSHSGKSESSTKGTTTTASKHHHPSNSSITSTTTRSIGGFNASAPYFDFTKYGNNTSAYNHYLSLHRDNNQCERSSLAWKSQYFTESVWKAPNTDAFSGESFFSTLFPENTASIQVLGNTKTSNPYYCCCCCSIYWPDVSVAYWPSPQANTQCLSQVGNNQGAFQDAMTAYFNTEDLQTAVNTGVLSAKPNGPRQVGANKRNAGPQGGPGLKGRNFHALSAPPVLERDNGSPVTTIGPDGFTYTSPYVYLEIPEVMAADGCGYVGNKYTSLRWSYQPEQISSIWVDDPSCWVSPWDDDADQFSQCDWQTKSFNFNDLPCPPESLRAAGHYEYIFNTDVPYAPLLAPPHDLQWLDPAWGSCNPTFGWDPYIALTPEANLEPATTASFKQESTSALPGPTAPSVPGPTHTTAVHNPPQPSSSTPKQESGPIASGSPAAGAIASGGPTNTASGVAASASADSSNGNGSSGAASAPMQFAPVTTDGHTISFAGDGSPVIAGQTLHPGETITLDGQTYAAPAAATAMSTESCSSDAPIVIIGTSTYSLVPEPAAATSTNGPASTAAPTKPSSASPSVTFQPPITSIEPLWVAIGGYVLTYTSNGVVVEGITMMPGTPYTIDSTLFSIPDATTTSGLAGPPASIVIGTSTYSLPEPPVTAPPTAIEIDGATLTEGHAAVLSELGGDLATISLGTDGNLVMGSTTVNVVATPVAHLGDIIWSALGGQTTEAAAASAPATATGGAGQRKADIVAWAGAVAAAVWLAV